MTEDILVMDAPDVRGSNNPLFGKQQCTHSENPNANGVNAKIEDGFVGALDADCEVIKEKPVHRAMLFMFARGDTDLQVAEETGYTAVHVGRIRRQPWMQKKLAEEIRKAGEKDVRELLNEMGPNCLRGIYDIAQDPAVKEEVKLRARQDIVDRWIGKACQPTKDETKSNIDDMSDEELAKIAKGDAK